MMRRLLIQNTKLRQSDFYRNVIVRTLSVDAIESSYHKFSKKIQTVWSTPERLIGIGDVHGDIHAFEELLLVAGLISEKGGDWTGGSNIAVQIGDLLDRGTGEVDILIRVSHLSQQAKDSGGAFITLVGNHEIMNYEGDFRYVSGEWGDGYLPFEKQVGSVLDQVNPDWRYSHEGLSKYEYEHKARAACFDVSIPRLHESIDIFRDASQVAVVVGDSLFVHAGLTAAHLNYVAMLAKPKNSDENILWELAMKDAQGCKYRAMLILLNFQSYAYVNNLPFSSDEVEGVPFLLTHPHGSVWMRHFSSPMGSQLQSSNVSLILEDVLSKLNCNRMVVGHTPQPCINYATTPRPDKGVSGLNDEVEIWRIDTGASSGIYNGPREVLEVTKDGSLSVLVAPNSPSPLPAVPYDITTSATNKLLRIDYQTRKAPLTLPPEFLH